VKCLEYPGIGDFHTEYLHFEITLTYQLETFKIQVNKRDLKFATGQ